MTRVRVAVVLPALAATAAVGPPASRLTTALLGSDDATAARNELGDNPAAKRLAARVARARTPAAGYRALVAVMRALNVGVYSADGKAVVRGAERSVHDFYLYDFQLWIMAAALSDDQSADLAELRRVLVIAGVKVNQKPVATRALWQAVLRLERGDRRRDVGVEVLKPQHLWIVSRGGGHAIDVEARDVVQPAGDLHAWSLASLVRSISGRLRFRATRGVRRC